MPRSLPSFLVRPSLIVGFVSMAMACGGGPPPTPEEAAYWVERTDAELDAELATACVAAKELEDGVLLAFSAPWCGDCRRVRDLEQQPPLSAELERWQKKVVNVGRFTRHRRLISHFEVGAIAYWVALEPGDCSQPVETWPVLRKGVFEPASNPKNGRSAADLAGWLVTARGS